MPLEKYCTGNSWSSDWALPGGRFNFTPYCLTTEPHNAIRQRLAALTPTGRAAALDRSPTQWPPGSWIWDSGIIQTIEDNGDGTIKITDDRLDGEGFAVHAWADGRWHGYSGPLTDAPTCAPANYRVVIFPLDDGTPPATSLADPNRGLVLTQVTDNGADWLSVTNDGRMTLNGESLSDYVGFGFHIIHNGGGAGGEDFKTGIGWLQRFPQGPNIPELDYGEVTAATTSTLTDSRDASAHAWKTPKDLSGAVGKDVAVKLSTSGVWVRLAVTDVSASGTGGSTNIDTLHFDAQATAPTGTWYLLTPGRWFRPERAIVMTRQVGRRGPFWDAASTSRYRPWATWYGGNLVTEPRVSHSPTDDALGVVGIQRRTITVDDGTDEGATIAVFDNDAITEAMVAPGQTCDISDMVFSPFLFWSLRGLQVEADALLGAAHWVKPGVDYEGKRVIPIWNQATWREYWQADDTRAAIITSVSPSDVGVATFDSITMPEITPQAGDYTSLHCFWALLGDDDEVIAYGEGTATATTLTDSGTRGFLDHPGPPDGDGITDVGLTLVIAFGRRRAYARRVRWLYPRTVSAPDNDGGAIWPPTHTNPGGYDTNDASTAYAEWTELGELEDTGAAFVDGESARYYPDDWAAPSWLSITDPDDSFSKYVDLAYQGLPALPSSGSSFPRFEGGKRGGTITSVDLGQLGDSSQLWWVSHDVSYPHGPFVADGASDAAHLVMASLDPDELDFWNSMGGHRFDTGGGMILEVEMDPGGAPGVYTRRPITTQDMSGTPTLTVSPPFPATIAGLNWQIREPGYIDGRGAILNLWRHRKVKITKADGSASAVVLIAQSDDDHIYYDEPEDLTPEVGDSYEITQLEPGVVVQRKTIDPASLDEVNGWVLTSSADATQDDRGHDWLTKTVGGISGARRNLPTVVKAFGNFRKGDYPLPIVWKQLKDSINCLLWILRDFDWSSRSPSNFLSDTPENNHARASSLSEIAGPIDAADGIHTALDEGAELIGNIGTAFDTKANVAASGIWGGDTFIGYGETEEDDLPPHAWWKNVAGGPFSADIRYAYAVVTATTDLLKSSFDLYVAADSFVPESTGSSPAINETRYDDEGDGLVFGEFKKYATLAADATINRRTSTPFGEIEALTPADNIVTQVGPNNSLQIGYEVTRWQAIEKFDVDGGFTYV